MAPAQAMYVGPGHEKFHSSLLLKSSLEEFVHSVDTAAFLKIPSTQNGLEESTKYVGGIKSFVGNFLFSVSV